MKFKAKGSMLGAVYFLVVVFLLLVASSALCAKSSVSIGYGGPPTARDYMKEVLEIIKAQLPDIEVKEVVYPTYEDMLALLPSQIAANTAPDLVWWTAGDVTDYFIKGAAEPLDDIVSSLGINLDEYIPAAVKAFTNEGKLYGVPLQAQSSAFVVNKSLLKQIGVERFPRSMNEVQDYAIKIKNSTGKAGVVLHLHVFHITHYVKSFGGGWGYGKTINSPENEKGLQFLVDLFIKHKVAVTPKDFGCAWDGEVFSRNEVAFSTGGTWYIGYMKAMNPDFEYALIPVPYATGGDGFVLLDSGGWSILKTAKDKDAAAKVLKYLASDEAQELLYTTPLLYIPAKSKFIDAYVGSVPEFGLLKDHFLSGINFDYPFENLKEFNDDLISGFERLIYKEGSLTVKELLDSLQEKYGKN